MMLKPQKRYLALDLLRGLTIALMIIVNTPGRWAILKPWIYKNGFLSWLTNYNASLLFAICFVLLLWIVGYIMDKRKIYIKV